MSWCKRIVRKDKNGRIIATGVEWTEFNIWAGVLDGLVDSMSLLVGSLMTMFGILAIIHSTYWLWLSAVGLGLLVLPVVKKSFDFWRTPRSLVFHVDGRVEAPHGFGYWPNAREMGQPHREIVSIEVRPGYGNGAVETPHRHDVAVFRRNGDIVHVARRLLPDDAHKVAVQLSLALSELREAIAGNATNGQGAARGTHQPSQGIRPKDGAVIS